MADVLISKLSTAIRDLESLLTGLDVLSCTDDELELLDALGTRLVDAATTVRKKTGSFRSFREEQAWKSTEELRSHGKSTIAALIKDGVLKRPTVFGRTVVTIFSGPKDAVLDSVETKARKAATRQRCEIIRKLDPDGVVAWAAAYPPTSWAVGVMGKDAFDCLVDDIEPESVQRWPPAVHEALHKLRDDTVLRSSVEYGRFMSG